MLGKAYRAVLSVWFYLELRARRVEVESFFWLYGMKPRIRNAGFMRIGRRFGTLGRVTRVQLSSGPAGKLLIGYGVGLNEGVSIHAEHEITIGDYVNIADYVSINDSDFHELEPGKGIKGGPVVIERNAWLGRNVIVLSGVTIGAHAVVAAGAVVTTDVPPNTLVGGNPARTIRLLDIPDPERFVRRRPKGEGVPQNRRAY